jgi:DNA-binding NtrC family response regulator
MTPSPCHNVLLVEPDAATTRTVLEVLAGRGVRGVVARDLAQAEERFDAGGWDLVLCDLAVPGDAMEVVRRIKNREPELPVVLLADRCDRDTAVRAVREGCDDVLRRPVERDALDALLDRVVPGHEVPVAADADSKAYRIVGRSPRLQEAVALARKVAPTSVPVLISGESGTGKELFAHLIHQSSRRRRGPYLRVNCAAVSESLLESELFGHERGAFTGAVTRRKGRFELANGGTLLLDEITETGPRLQAELLRVLEQQDFQRVGGSTPVQVNVRIVSTTNRDLTALVRKGEFRSDLYYRLAGVRVHIPPLRHRREDLPVLVRHFVNQFAGETQRRVARFDPEMMELFTGYAWPGNVRQLRNVVRTALVLGEGDVLSLAEAPWLAAELAQSAHGPPARSLRLEEVERRTILEALRITDSHQARAAELLGISDRTLRDKLRRYRQEHEPQREEEAQWIKAPA